MSPKIKIVGLWGVWTRPKIPKSWNLEFGAFKIMKSGLYCTNVKQKNPTELSGSSFLIIYITKKSKMEVKHEKSRLLVIHADPSKSRIWNSALLL